MGQGFIEILIFQGYYVKSWVEFWVCMSTSMLMYAAAAKRKWMFNVQGKNHYARPLVVS